MLTNKTTSVRKDYIEILSPILSSENPKFSLIFFLAKGGRIALTSPIRISHIELFVLEIKKFLLHDIFIGETNILNFMINVDFFRCYFHLEVKKYESLPPSPQSSQRARKCERVTLL